MDLTERLEELDRATPTCCMSCGAILVGIEDKVCHDCREAEQQDFSVTICELCNSTTPCGCY